MNNKALQSLYLYNSIFVLAGGLFGPLYAVFLEERGAGVVIISMTWAIFLFSSTFFTFIVARFGDTVKEREYLLLAGYLVRAIVWFLFIFVSSIWFLVILQILLGLGEALGSPSFDALMAEHLDKGKHIKSYADMKVIFNLSSAIAIVCGGIIVVYLGFEYLFITMSLLALVSFFGILFKPRKLL